MRDDANNRPVIAGAVEGLLDEVVLRRLIRHIGAEPGAIYGRRGKQYLQKFLPACHRAADKWPWVVLVDLDQDAACAVPFRAAWLPRPAPRLCFRVVVREIEAWILADRARVAQFLGVAERWVPPRPEEIADPKQTMIALAGRSRSKRLRHEMVPRPGSFRPTGPAYNARLIRFVSDRKNGWRPEVAANSSESLRRALNCLRRLAAMPPAPDR